MEKLKTIILVPYAASSESKDAPSAEAKYLFEEHFINAGFKQILGTDIEGKLFISGDTGLYIIGEGKTNASMYTTALLNSNEVDISDAKFILFGCCGSVKGTGVVGDIYFVGETADMDLGHHADSRENGSSQEHS